MANDTWVPQVNGVGPVLVALWAEDFDSFRRFGTLPEALGFAAGWRAGGDQYGAGRCMAFVLSGAALAALKAEPDIWDVVRTMAHRAGIAAEVEGAC